MSQEGIRTAPLGTRWLRKMVIIIVVLLAFGGWGLYDAVSVYPKRGERFASWAKWSYLGAARNANTEDFGVFEREASVPSPVEELARLSAADTRTRNETDASNPASSRRLRAIMQQSRRAWLEGLDRIGQLTPERTKIDNPRAELEALEKAWQTAESNPKPLSYFDLPMQWAIMGVCWTIALIMIVRLVKVAGTKYRWDESTQTLTLPGGQGITPDDIAEFDKRKFDKFIWFATIKPGRAGSLGGRELKFDTYQHAELESWLEAMEKTAFPSQEAPEGSDAASPENQDDAND